MIPAIGTMIALYIGFRMLEVLFFNTNRYRGETAHVFIMILAIIVAILVLLSWVSLVTTSTVAPKP